MTPLRLALFGFAALTLASGPASAQAPAGRPATAPAVAAPKDRPSAFGTMGSNREPIKIDADRLDVFDREGKAVFAGNVVAVQGETTMRCNVLTVLYEGRANQAGARPAALPSQGPGESAIKKIDCTGPVTIVSKTQVATGDNATFDRVANRVLLNGNATLTDGQNVTQGGRVVYDLNTGVANIENPAAGGRVRALFVPGSAPTAAPATPAKPAAPR